MTRALGHTSDRLALWQVEALVEDMSTRYELDDTTARLLVLDRLADLAPVLEAQLAALLPPPARGHRRPLRRRVRRARRPGADRTALPLARAVGFADMVSFTRRTAGLGSTDLSQFVQRFEAAARDVVTAAGGRVVKTIGDAVLFVADDPADGCARRARPGRRARARARRATAAPGGLAEGARGVTPVRVGMVWGARPVPVRRRVRADGQPRGPADGHRRAQHGAGRHGDGARAGPRPAVSLLEPPAR